MIVFWKAFKGGIEGIERIDMEERGLGMLKDFGEV
jgi:hypothetical protein